MSTEFQPAEQLPQSGFVPLRFLDSSFKLAHAVEIIPHCASIFCADLTLKIGDLRSECVKNAAVLLATGELLGRAAALSEQALERSAGIDFDWKWSRWSTPRHCVHVNTAVLAIA